MIRKVLIITSLTATFLLYQNCGEGFESINLGTPTVHDSSAPTNNQGMQPVGEPIQEPVIPEPVLVDPKPQMPNMTGLQKIKSYKFSGVSESVRKSFGCNGNYEQKHFTPQTQWSYTHRVSNSAEMNAALDKIKGGERILITDGSSFGDIILKSTNGSSTQKKYIMGASGCSGSGNETMIGGRFDIKGDHWVIMNIKTREGPGDGIFAFVKGSYNIIYNNYLSKAGRIRFQPQGEFRNSKTRGNKIINNLLRGAGAGSRHIGPGISFWHPYSGKLPATFDTAIIGNTFDNFSDPKYQSLAIVDTSWGLGHPESGGLTPDPVYLELAHNHFQRCNSQIFNSKTTKHWIHDNLFENLSTDGDAAHLQLRSGGDKLFSRNILVTPGSRSIITNGGLNRGYFNVLVSPGSFGLTTSWTAAIREDAVPMFDNRERVINNDWQWNFFLGTKTQKSAHWMSMLLSRGTQYDTPPKDNIIKNNIYCSPQPKTLTWNMYSYPGHEGLTRLSEADWVKNNPQGVRSLQHFATRNESGVCSLNNLVEMPEFMVSKGFWLNGKDVITRRPSWVNGSSDSVISTNSE